MVALIRLLGLGRLWGSAGLFVGRFVFAEEPERTSPGKAAGDVTGRMVLIGGVGFALLRWEKPWPP
ncbi:hypothetical protein AB0C52_12820 [Streptomyces sp. NPDC048717]|uniref:hypothetical protein n=1 Tax=Streptomyces sp. NPDC048717 TaxID=3154928 RepID=UPI00344916D0